MQSSQSFPSLQFVALLATLALANAGIIAEQPSYSHLSYATPVKTLVQPVAYAADHHYHHEAPVKTLVQPVAYSADHYHHAPASSSSSFTKTVSYSQPKAYIAAAQPEQHYYHAEPQQHYYQAEPQHHVYAAAPDHHYAHGTSEQNIVRSHHGTVSHISKSVNTPHSSVHKYDTRVINDGYKTLQYAQPTAYVHQPAVHSYQPEVHSYQPAVHSYQPEVHSYQPLLTKTISQPIIQKTLVSQPIVQKTVAVHQPTHYQPTTYAQHAPVLASKVHYSPAIEVAHASFESPVAHYSW